MQALEEDQNDLADVNQPQDDSVTPRLSQPEGTPPAEHPTTSEDRMNDEITPEWRKST